MHSLYIGVAAVGVRIALCLVHGTSQRLKPVVPKYCQRLCDETVGPCTFVYRAWDLSCYILTPKSDSAAKKRHLLKLAVRSEWSMGESQRCPTDKMFVKNATELTHIRGRRRVKTIFKGPKKKSCINRLCTASRNFTSQGKDCILLRIQNMTIASQDQLIALPMTVKPGMTLHVCGGYLKDTTYAQLSFTKIPENPSNPFHWVHITPRWSSKNLDITEGLRKTTYNGRFPISNPARFNLSLKLSSSSTKIYADKVRVRTIGRIFMMKEFFVRRYDKIYSLEVKKTEDGCDEVDNGIP